MLLDKIKYDEEYFEVVGSNIISNDLENMNTIKWYQSKTVWFNVVISLIAFLALPEFVRLLSPKWLQYDLLLSAIGNLVLRIWFTKSVVSSTM